MQLEGINLVTAQMLDNDQLRNSKDNTQYSTALKNTRDEHYYKRLALNIQKLKRLLKHASMSLKNHNQHGMQRYGAAASYEVLTPHDELNKSPLGMAKGVSFKQFTSARHQEMTRQIRIRNKERQERVQENLLKRQASIERDLKTVEKRKKDLEIKKKKNMKLERAENLVDQEEKIAKYADKLNRKKEFEKQETYKSLKAFHQ